MARTWARRSARADANARMQALERARILALGISLAYFFSLMSNFIGFIKRFYVKEPVNTSVLTGHAWVQELLNGHRNRIHSELGVRKHVFRLLVDELRGMGYIDSRHVTLEEQLAIFLWTCCTGVLIRHVGERFQHALPTISK